MPVMIRAKFSPGCLAPGPALWAARGGVWEAKQQEVYKLSGAETEVTEELSGLGHSQGNEKEMFTSNLTPFLRQEMLISFLTGEGSVPR